MATIKHDSHIADQSRKPKGVKSKSEVDMERLVNIKELTRLCIQNTAVLRTRNVYFGTHPYSHYRFMSFRFVDPDFNSPSFTLSLPRWPIFERLLIWELYYKS